MISPKFEQLSDQYKDVVFIKVDVDKQQVLLFFFFGYSSLTYMLSQDIARECGITAMPTFQFYKSKQKVAEFRGAGFFFFFFLFSSFSSACSNECPPPNFANRSGQA